MAGFDRLRLYLLLFLALMDRRAEDVRHDVEEMAGVLRSRHSWPWAMKRFSRFYHTDKVLYRNDRSLQDAICY